MMRNLRQLISQRYSIERALEALLSEAEREPIDELVLFWLHIIIVPGIALRFVLNMDYYFREGLHLEFAMVWIALALYTPSIILLHLFRRHSGGELVPSSILWTQAIVDTVFFSAFYYLSERIQTSLFLLYFLPLVTIAGYFTMVSAFIILCMVVFSFGSVTALMLNDIRSIVLLGHLNYLDFLKAFCPKAFFLCVVFFVGFHYRKLEISHGNALHAFLRGIGTGISVIDKGHKIRFMNPIKKRWSPNAEYGMTCYKGFNDPIQKDNCVGCPVEATFKSLIVEQAITHSPDPQGHVRHSIVTASPLRNLKGYVFAALEIINDITALVELQNLSQDLAESDVSEDIIRLALEGMCRMVKADRAIFANIMEAESKFHVLCQFEPQTGFTKADYWLDAGPSFIKKILEGEYIEVSDLKTHEDAGKHIRRLARELKIGSVLITPIEASGKPSGIIALESRGSPRPLSVRGKSFSVQEIGLVLSASSHLGTSLAKARKMEMARLLAHRMSPTIGHCIVSADFLASGNLHETERDYHYDFLVNQMMNIDVLMEYLLDQRPATRSNLASISLDRIFEMLTRCAQVDIADRLEVRNYRCNINVSTEIQPELGSIMIPKGFLLYKALDNLVTNSIDAILRSEMPEGKIILSALQDDCELLLNISDDGPGMLRETAEVIETIIRGGSDPFSDLSLLGTWYGSHPMGRHRNLGIKVTVWIVMRLMRGNIELLAHEQGRTTFQIRLRHEGV